MNLGVAVCHTSTINHYLQGTEFTNRSDGTKNEENHYSTDQLFRWNKKRLAKKQPVEM